MAKDRGTALYDAINMAKGSSSADKMQEVSERELCDFVKSRVEEARINASRQVSEGTWATNIAYLMGYDGFAFDVAMRQFRPIAFPGTGVTRSRISVNEILPRAQNRCARICKNPPRYDVRPKSTSDEDKDASRLGLYIINQTWESQKVNKKRLELVMWAQQCGHTYLKTCWDKMLGPKVPQMGEDGKMRMKPIGDIRIDVINAFEVFPDPIAKSFDEITWLVQARIRPLHYFRDQYGEKGGLVEAEDVWLTSLQYETRINTFNSYTGGAGGQSNVIKNAAIELSYYEVPSYKNPNGRMIVTSNGIMLENKELPIDCIPFSKFDDVLVAGKYYSESVITHARPVQDQYNRVVSRRADWANDLLAGKYMAARGHGLQREALNDTTEVVEYDPVPGASPPTAMSIPNIPQYAYQEDDYLLRKLDNIFGINEVSRGQLPSASIPAIGMEFLVEQDDTRIGVITEQHEHAYASTGQQILKYAAKYMDYPRLLKMAGKGMEYTVQSFVGADLLDNDDVIVVRGSTQPGSKTVERQNMLNLYQQGVLGDPKDPKVIENLLSALEFGDIQEVWKDHSLDMGQVKKGIRAIEEGIKPPVSEFDNHVIWLQELNRYRKSDKFERLQDDAKMILLETMNDHLNEVTNLQVPDSSADPMLQESDAAQQVEGQIQAEEHAGIEEDLMGEEPPPEGAPIG